MSELGMKYFDFEFSIDGLKPAKVHYIMASLNKKLLVKLLDKDFRLLLFPPDIEKSNIMINEMDISKLLVKKNELIYLFNPAGTIAEIRKRHKSKPVIGISGYKQNYPDSINIDHGRISFEYESVK